MALVLALFLVSGAAAVGDNLPTSQSNTNNYNIEQGELSQTSFWDGIIDSLSFQDVQPSYEQGERAEVRVKATFTKDFQTSNAEKIVNIYKCKDTGCDDPPPITDSSEDQCSQEEWYPDYDDCIEHHSEGFSSDLGYFEGGTYEWGVEFDAPQDTGQYILVGYIFSSEKGFVSDVSKEKFIVEEKTTDSDGDGVIDSVDQCPYEYGEQDNGCPIDSDNDGVADKNDACPNTYGEDSDGCPIETDSDGDGVLDSNDDCPNTAGSGSDGCPVVNVEEVDGEIPVERSNQDEVMATVEFINTGDGDMQNTHIVEMQVNKAGTGLLSLLAFSDYDDEVCDGENNQAVHETFRLDSGEQRQYILTVPIENLEKGQKYDVMIVTRSSCHNTGDNNPVDPYGTGVKAGQYTVENASTPGDADRDGDGIINVNDDCPDKAGSESNNGCPEGGNSNLLIPVLLTAAGAALLFWWYISG